MRPPKQFGQQHAGLREAVIVGLQSGEDEVELLVLDGSGQHLGKVQRIEGDEPVILQVNGSVSTFGQGFAQHLLRARRSGGDDHDFAAMLLALAQCFFQCIGIRLVDFIGHVVANPRATLVQL